MHMYTVCPHRSQQNCTTYNCSSCQYQNDTQIISGLQLHAELEHFDDSYFGIVLKWNRPSTAAGEFVNMVMCIEGARVQTY